jgi:hypothetical protein
MKTIKNLIFLKILLILILCLSLCITMKIKFNHKEQNKKIKNEYLPMISMAPSLFHIKIIHTNSHMGVTHPLTTIPSFLPSPRIITTTLLKNHNLNLNHKTKYIECVLKEGHLTLAKTSLSEGGLSSLGDEALAVKVILNTQNLRVFYSGDVEILKINLDELETVEKSMSNHKCFKINDSFGNIYKFCGNNSESSDEWIRDILKFKTECGRNKEDKNLVEKHTDITENIHHQENYSENKNEENKNNSINRINSNSQENLNIENHSDQTLNNQIKEKENPDSDKTHQQVIQKNTNDNIQNHQNSGQDESMMKNFITTANKLITEISNAKSEKDHKVEQTNSDTSEEESEFEDMDSKPEKKRIHKSYRKYAKKEPRKDQSAFDSRKHIIKSPKHKVKREDIKPPLHKNKRSTKITHKVQDDVEENESQTNDPDNENESDKSENNPIPVKYEVKHISPTKFIKPEVTVTPINNQPQPCNCEVNKECCNKLKEIDKQFDKKLRKFFNKQNTHSKKLMSALKTLKKIEDKDLTENELISNPSPSQHDEISKGLYLSKYINEVVDKKLNDHSNSVPSSQNIQGSSISQSGNNSFTSNIQPIPQIQNQNNNIQPQTSSYPNNYNIQSYPQNNPYQNYIQSNPSFKNNLQGEAQSNSPQNYGQPNNQLTPNSPYIYYNSSNKPNQQLNNQLIQNSNLQAGNINQQTNYNTQNNPTGNNLPYDLNNTNSNNQFNPNLTQQNNFLPQSQVQIRNLPNTNNNNNLTTSNNNIKPNDPSNSFHNQNLSNINNHNVSNQILNKNGNLAYSKQNDETENSNESPNKESKIDTPSNIINNQQTPSTHSITNTQQSQQNQNYSQSHPSNKNALTGSKEDPFSYMDQKSDNNKKHSYSNNNNSEFNSNNNDSNDQSKNKNQQPEQNNSNDQISSQSSTSNSSAHNDQDQSTDTSDSDGSQNNIQNGKSNISGQHSSSNDDSTSNTSNDSTSHINPSHEENGLTTTTTTHIQRKRIKKIIRHDSEGNKIIKHITTIKTLPMENKKSNRLGEQHYSNGSNSIENSDNIRDQSTQNTQTTRILPKSQINQHEQKISGNHNNENNKQPKSNSSPPIQKFVNPDNPHKLLKPLGGIPARASESENQNQKSTQEIKRTETNRHLEEPKSQTLINKNSLSYNSTEIKPTHNRTESHNDYEEHDFNSDYPDSSQENQIKTITTRKHFQKLNNSNTLKNSTTSTQQSNQTDNNYEEVNIDICFTNDKKSMIDYWKNEITRRELKHYVLSSDNFCHICCRNELDESSLDLRCCRERCDIQQGKLSHVSFECVGHHSEMNKRGLDTPKPTQKNHDYEKNYESVITNIPYQTFIPRVTTHFVTVKPAMYVPKVLPTNRYMLSPY